MYKQLCTFINMLCLLHYSSKNNIIFFNGIFIINIEIKYYIDEIFNESCIISKSF